MLSALFVPALVGAASVRAETCTLARIAELPVTMNGTRPMVHAAINGQDALFIADSGAFYSSLTPAAAGQFKLNIEPAPAWFYLVGVGGDARAWVTTVKTFTIFKLDVPHVEFLVAGNDLGGGAVGLLGQNVFRFGDTEYDLANAVIRINRPKGDCKKTALAYWASAAGKDYSVINIDFSTREHPHTEGTAYVNGHKVRVMFDTGASTSLLTLEAAKRAGVKPDSPGVVPAGFSHGIGRRTVRSWIAPFESFRIGDEEVKNTHLRIADEPILGVDMLVGADFFLSHHIYVATSQSKLYFTYNGGPVFDLSHHPAATADAGADVGDAAPSAEAAAPAPGTESLDAAGYMQRGTAYRARRDYEHALADLTRACELAPGEAGYHYERGVTYWESKQPDKALADFDAALKLKPDDVPSLVARAGLHASMNAAGSDLIPDLDAADRAAAKEADTRLHLGDLYGYASAYPAAVIQYTKWIDTHQRDDIQMARALNSRCWARAIAGVELDAALADCDSALRRKSDSASYHDSRGLVYLRRGDYEKAIADYDAALRLNPKIAWSLYGRGLAKLRKGQAAAGQADIAAATALQPKLSERAAKFGLSP